MLDQRKAVEEKEIQNEVVLEQLRTDREIAITEEARKRESSDIEKTLKLEQERRDKEIALIAKAREEELTKIQRNLALEKAEKDREIELIDKAKEQELAEIRRQLAQESADKDREIELTAKERERQRAEIDRATEVLKAEEAARDARHQAGEEVSRSMRRRALETRLSVLEVEKDEAFAEAQQEREISDERARVPQRETTLHSRSPPGGRAGGNR